VQGYDELSALERPLVGAHDDEDYEQEHGVPRPGAEGAVYRPPGGAAGEAAVAASGGSFTAAVPSQVDELREVSVLSKDAAEILWEMVLLADPAIAEDVADMRAKAEQLQSQLRGLIGDYAGGDEALLASGIEAFDMLSRCLDEQKGDAAAAAAPARAAAAANAGWVAPPGGVAGRSGGRARQALAGLHHPRRRRPRDGRRRGGPGVEPRGAARPRDRGHSARAHVAARA
jgi:hypothetical protein